MFKINKIIDKCLDIITDNVKKKIPIDFFDCLMLKVSDFKDCGGYDDIKFSFNPQLSYVISPDNTMCTAIGIFFASILKKNGFTVPQNLCNPYGFKFLCACYIISKTACYIETNGAGGTKSRIIKGVGLQEIDTPSKKKSFESDLENYCFPAYTIDISVMQDKGKMAVGEYTKYKFCFPNSERTVKLEDGSMVHFVSISPLVVLDRIAKLYIRWAEKHLLKLKYFKRDGSLRIARVTVNRDILMKMFDDNVERVDWVLNSFEMEKGLIHRGYIKLPEIDLPADDSSGVRAVNLLQILEFSLDAPSKARVDSIVQKNCAGARYVLINELSDEGLDQDKKLLLSQATLRFFEKGFDDLAEYAKAKLHLNKLPEIVMNRLKNVVGESLYSPTEFDKRAYNVLEKVYGTEQADKMFETRKINLHTGLTDVTSEYMKAESKYAFATELARAKCVVIDYVKKDGTFERTAFTLNKDVVDKVYGLSWRSVSQNATLSAQIKVIEGYIDIVESNFSGMYNSIANELGISIGNCKTMVEIKESLTKALRYKLNELKVRHESSRSAVQKRKESMDIGGYCLTVDPYLVSQKTGTLWRSYKVDGVKSIFTVDV